jgi:hypothetical protein
VSILGKWRRSRERRQHLLRECRKEIDAVVSNCSETVGRTASMSEADMLRAVRRLHGLKRRSRSYELVCETGERIAAISVSSASPPGRKRWLGPVPELPSSEAPCPECHGGGYQYGPHSGTGTWDCPHCGGEGTVEVDNSHYLAVIDSR